MHDNITAFVGLDVHKEAIAIAVADAGRTGPRFLGTVRPTLIPLENALAHLGSPGPTVAGPSGAALINAPWRK
jgi:hypothetical protein